MIKYVQRNSFLDLTGSAPHPQQKRTRHKRKEVSA